MVFQSYSVNYLSILIATVASFMVGWLWYGPLFGKKWAKEMGIKMDKNNKEGLGKLILLNFIGTLIMVYVLALFIKAFAITILPQALQLAFWLWLGFFAATTLLGGVLWEGKSWCLYQINASYWLVNLGVAASVLTLFG